MLNKALALLSVLALAIASPASAADKPAPDRLLDLGRIEAVAEALREAGYKAEVKKDDKGNRYIISAANGSSFSVEFFGCKPEIGCPSLQFYAWYKKEPGFTVAMANAWNAEKRFLKAYIDKDGDLGTTMDLTTTGKLTYANFADFIDWWSVMSGDLFTFIDKRKESLEIEK